MNRIVRLEVAALLLTLTNRVRSPSSATDRCSAEGAPLAPPTIKALALAFLGLLLCVASSAGAESAALACFERRPEPDSVRAMRMTAKGRAGENAVLVLRLYGRRNEQGVGQLFLRVDEPERLRGTSLLMLQRAEGETDIYLASPAQPTPRPIRGPERSQGMFGTDFTYEDLERVQHGWRPGAAEIVELPAAKVGDRAAHVIEVRPRDSTWERIVFSLDQESCLPLLVRFFERGEKSARKELTADVHSHVKHGDLWVLHSALLRDWGTYTSTHLMVDSHRQEALLPDGQFTVEGLERAVHEGANPAR